MKIVLMLCSITLLSSWNLFAQLSPQDFEKALNDIKKTYLEKINECQVQNDLIITKAISEIDEKEIQNGIFIFSSGRQHFLS